MEDLNHNRQQITPGRLPPPPGFIFPNFPESRIPGIPPVQMDERDSTFNQFGYASSYPRAQLAHHGNIDVPV